MRKGTEMKISKRQLRKALRRAINEAPEMSGTARDAAKDILVQVALFFIYKDENATGADIYDEVFRRVGGPFDEETISDAIDALAKEYGEA